MSEQLAVIPRQHYVFSYRRAKYASKHYVVAGAEQGIRIEPRQYQILLKSIAHHWVIAHVVIRKFVDGPPFSRQEVIYIRVTVQTKPFFPPPKPSSTRSYVYLYHIQEHSMKKPRRSRRTGEEWQR